MVWLCWRFWLCFRLFLCVAFLPGEWLLTRGILLLIMVSVYLGVFQFTLEKHGLDFDPIILIYCAKVYSPLFLPSIHDHELNVFLFCWYSQISYTFIDWMQDWYTPKSVHICLFKWEKGSSFRTSSNRISVENSFPVSIWFPYLRSL